MLHLLLTILTAFAMVAAFAWFMARVAPWLVCRFGGCDWCEFRATRYCRTCDRKEQRNAKGEWPQ